MGAVFQWQYWDYVETSGASNNFGYFKYYCFIHRFCNDIYVQYNLSGSGNTYIFVDEDSNGSVSAGDTLIILSGLSGSSAVDSSDFI